MDEFKLKNFNKFVENFKLKQQQEFKPTVEENVNEVVERLNLPEVKEKLDSIKFKEKELGVFKELSDEEVEQALEKDSNKTKIIETLKKLNFKNVSQGAKEEICEVEGAKTSPTVDDIEVGAGSGKSKRHVFKSVSFTAGLEYLNSLSVRTTKMTPSIEPPVVIPTSEPTNEPTIPEGAIVLARAGSSEVTTDTPSSKTITVTTSEQTVILKNPFTGENYKYTITLADQTPSGTTSSSLKFSFLANGRLVVTGNYAKIQAWDLNVGDKNEQHDDMIIVGNYNEIYTGKGNDTVRVGLVIDDGNKNYTMNSAENLGVGLRSSTDTKYFTSAGNKIYTGDGDDYVTMFGKTYTVDMGDGDDKFLVTSYYSENSSLTYVGVNPSKNRILTNCEENTTQESKDGAASADNLDGWFRQSGVGDCVMLSYLNSTTLGDNSFDLSQFMTVTKTSSGYNVTFKNYQGSSNNTISVTNSELSGSHAGNGDFDTLLYMTALEKILLREYREEWLDKSSGYYYKGYEGNAYYIPIRTYIYGGEFTYKGSDGNDVTETIPAHGEYDSSKDDTFDWLLYIGNHQVSKLSLWLFGEEKSCTFTKYSTTKTVDGKKVNTTVEERKAEFKTRFLNLWSHYEKGEIRMLAISPRKYNPAIGLAAAHFYCLKYVDTVKEYVEIVNPWDDNDVVRLSYDDFFSLYSTIQISVCGHNGTEINAMAKTPAA